MRASVPSVMWMCWVCALVLAQFPALAEEQPKPSSPIASVPVAISALDSGSSESLNLSLPDPISGVIYPHQSATVGTEVRGIVDVINFKEGDSVAKGSIVAEISKARYASIVGEFKGNYDAVVRTLDRAREELSIQEELYDNRATTYDDVVKARSQVQVLEARKEEALHKLKQAELNLDACVLKAPF
jgi:multidrug efflux pump subunit AcrA (membrane-fusion protein)